MASVASCAAVSHGLHAVRAVASIPDGARATAGRACLQSSVFCLKGRRIECAHHTAALPALRQPEILSWPVLGSERSQNAALPAVNIRWPAAVRAPDDNHPAADKIAIRMMGVIAFIDHRTAAYGAIRSFFGEAGITAY